jgi:hypothetical protein
MNPYEPSASNPSRSQLAPKKFFDPARAYLVSILGVLLLGLVLRARINLLDGDLAVMSVGLILLFLAALALYGSVGLAGKTTPGQPPTHLALRFVSFIVYFFGFLLAIIGGMFIMCGSLTS